MTDEGLLGEDEAFRIALDDHPEYRPGWEKGTLPEEVVDDDGNVMSPHVHLTVHSIIERQIANDEPQGVAEIARKLDELGVSRHEVRHEIGQPLAGQMWHMLQEGCTFDEERYMAELREIVARKRPQGQ